MFLGNNHFFLSKYTFSVKKCIVNIKHVNNKMTHFPLYSKCKTDNRTNTAVGFFFNQIVLEEKYIVQNTFKI